MYSGVSGDWVLVIQLQQPLKCPIKISFFEFFFWWENLRHIYITCQTWFVISLFTLTVGNTTDICYCGLIGHSPKKWLVVKLVNKVLGHSEIFLFVLKGVISLFVWKQKKKDKNTIWIGSSLENWPWQFWHHLFFLHFFLINVDLP